MAVYVDSMRARRGRLILCHMIADTEAELHAMADRIGVARRWHQGDHYDIALSKRALAVEAGAREIKWIQASAMMMNARAGFRMGTPETALAIVRERFTREAARRCGVHDEPAFLIACNHSVARGYAEIDLRWRRIGEAEFMTERGERVRIVHDLRQLRGRPRGARIFFGPRRYEHRDAQQVRAMIDAGVFVEATP